MSTPQRPRLGEPSSRPSAAEVALAPTLYYDRAFDCEAAKILPGEFYVTSGEMVLVTVLGSCVAACIRDRLSGIGGMNHFMLPNGAQAGVASESARYGGFAMELLINQLLKLGARRNQLEAKVFGGGNVLLSMGVAHVGERNADFVLNYLETEKIALAAHDLADTCPRKVYFWPTTGRVMVRRLKSLHNTTILDREREYQTRIAQEAVAGAVELF